MEHNCAPWRTSDCINVAVCLCIPSYRDVCLGRCSTNNRRGTLRYIWRPSWPQLPRAAQVNSLPLPFPPRIMPAAPYYIDRTFTYDEGCYLRGAEQADKSTCDQHHRSTYHVARGVLVMAESLSRLEIGSDIAETALNINILVF